VKLLLDEMWPPSIAVQLRQRGHDVVAVAERPELMGQTDDAVWAAAQADGWVVVTENVVDYRPLAAEDLRQGRSHCGLILTSNQRVPRHRPGTIGRLVVALDELVSAGVELMSSEYWLA
jgi:predicted nuclease of predicted toxin-antitoxin system